MLVSVKQRTVCILLFQEVEVLDFAGPYEVFSITSLSGDKAFKVFTVAEKDELISARNGLKIQPDYCFDDVPSFDILVVPGGLGAEEIEIRNDKLLQWIRKQAGSVEILASVCTGAFLLAEAGLLKGKRATTHWMDIDRLEREYPDILVERGLKYVDEASVITSGGISAGINMSFYLVNKLVGEQSAKETAKRMEYDIVL